MRCRATERERGEPIWQTRSTEPMSIPSSREAVATRAHTSPAFSFFSAASRNLRDKLPWCVATASLPRRSPHVISDGVDFVHNNSHDIPQDFAALLRG